MNIQFVTLIKNHVRFNVNGENKLNALRSCFFFTTAPTIISENKKPFCNFGEVLLRNISNPGLLKA